MFPAWTKLFFSQRMRYNSKGLFYFVPKCSRAWWSQLQHYERLKGDCVAKNGSAYFFCSGPHVSYPFTALIYNPQPMDINIKSVCKNVFNFPPAKKKRSSSNALAQANARSPFFYDLRARAILKRSDVWQREETGFCGAKDGWRDRRRYQSFDNTMEAIWGDDFTKKNVRTQLLDNLMSKNKFQFPWKESNVRRVRIANTIVSSRVTCINGY